MDWELKNKIEKIVESNCKEIPYEGTEVDKSGIVEAICELITENYLPIKKEEQEF